MRAALKTLAASFAILVVGAPACTQIMGNDYTLLEPKDLGPCNPFTPGDCPSNETCDSDVCVKSCPENSCGDGWCDASRHLCTVPLGTPCTKAGESGCGSTLHCIDRDRQGLPTAPYCTTHPYDIPGQMCPPDFPPSGSSSADDCLKP